MTVKCNHFLWPPHGSRFVNFRGARFFLLRAVYVIAALFHKNTPEAKLARAALQAREFPGKRITFVAVRLRHEPRKSEPLLAPPLP